MAEMRLRGIKPGDAVNFTDITVGSDSGSLNIAAFQSVGADITLPKITPTASQFAGDIFTLDEIGLTVTAREWRDTVGNTLGTGTTLDTTSHGGKQVLCRLTAGGEDYDTPPMMVYTSMGDAGHDATDSALLDLVPHDEATHIFIGNVGAKWSFASSWSTGQVPRHGAKVLIPNGTTCTYDEANKNIRLDWIRVDGTLQTAQDQSCYFFYGELVVTRGGTLTHGTNHATRLPSTYEIRHTISGKNYADLTYGKTDLDLSRDRKLLGRGFIAQGTVRMWGNKKLPWSRAEPISSAATSLTLVDDPTGWVVGDELIIGGTKIGLTNADRDKTSETEYVTITSITDKTIGWTGGLTHDHDDQHSGRNDLKPVVALRSSADPSDTSYGRNISFTSEVTDDSPRRGHFMAMHHHCIVDLWDIASISMGRTNAPDPVGVIEGLEMWSNGEINNQANDAAGKTGQFKYYPGTTENSGQSTTWEDMTARSNRNGRYPWHLHHTAFGRDAADVPRFVNLYAEDILGWGYVDHKGENRLSGCVAHLFDGCGFVGEGANENGFWDNCLAIGGRLEYARHTHGYDLGTAVKALEGSGNSKGWRHRHAVGFGFRGRMVRTSRCCACDVWIGANFMHRGSQNMLSLDHGEALDRENISFQDAWNMNTSTAIDKFDFVAHPIRGLNDLEVIGAQWGWYVLKDNPATENDVLTHIKRLKMWGIGTDVVSAIGADPDYVGLYFVDSADITPAPSMTITGLKFAGASFQQAIRNITVDGPKFGINFGGGDSGGRHSNHSADNPRFLIIGADIVDATDLDIRYGQSHNTGVTTESVTFVDEDQDGTLLDWDTDPSSTYPLVIGTAANDNSVTFDATRLDNTDGAKVDNLNSLGEVAPRPMLDDLFDVSESRAENLFARDGVYTYSGDEHYVGATIISDRLTARPAKITQLVKLDGTAYPSGTYTNNGTFTYAVTGITRADVVDETALNTDLVIDIETGCTGAGGAGTYTLDERDFIPPDNGEIAFNGDGTLTYSPDLDFSGPDEWYVFVESQGRYKTVKCMILVDGDEATQDAPVIDTNISAAAGGAGEIDVTCSTPPDAGGRFIETVFYSTDAGTTWRRLGHIWKEMARTITVDSTGAALTAGAYNIRFRYMCNHDRNFSPASGDDSVTVT